jgi:serine protease Do
MNTRIKKYWQSKIARWLLGPALALLLAGGFAVYEVVSPAAAQAAPAPAPAAAPLNPDSVSALLALDHAMETVAARVTPAVVNVAVTSRTKPAAAQEQFGSNDDQQNPFEQFFGPFFQQMRPQPQIEHGIGSGVIISPDGYIVTNDHVVKGAMDIRVTLSDRKVMSAKLIGADPLTDLAVIKVDGTNLPSVPWGNSTDLRPGQIVLAFGNPYGFRFTVTQGIVSAVNRPNPFETNRRAPGEFIQTDAAINPGNSGGPLVDARGEVIGINTFLVSSSGSFSGMGFAIPSQLVKPTVDTLIRYGKVSHGYMGIGISDVTPGNAKFFHMNQASGAVVTQVEADSPAAKAGLKIGDVITAVDNQKVTDAGALQVIVGEKRPGTKINLAVDRSGQQITLPVTLEAMGSRTAENGSSGAEQGKSRWGLGLSDLTPNMRQELQVPDSVHGAVVTKVQPGTPADEAGLSRGDVILQVNHQNVQSPSDVQRALSSVPKGQDALVLVWSQGGNTFRVLPAPSAGQPS